MEEQINKLVSFQVFSPKKCLLERQSAFHKDLSVLFELVNHDVISQSR
jgi:hypothetical protein